MKHFDRRQALAFLGATSAAACTPGAREIRRSDFDTPLAELAGRKGLRFGTALGSKGLGDPAYCALIARECNQLVAENEHKIYAILPDDEDMPGAVSMPDRAAIPDSADYQFERGDALTDFAEQNNMAMRGHVLLWDSMEFVPDWVSSVNWGEDGVPTMQAFLDSYIGKVATQSGTRITSWDVVNESVNNDTGEFRDTIFRQYLGDDLFDVCFSAARKYAPHAQLVYNDFMTWEPGSAKHRDGVLRLLEDLRKRGTPIDAFGIQSHLGIAVGDKVNGFPDPQAKEWVRWLDEIVGMGYDLLITELDVNDTYLMVNEATRDTIMADYAGAYLDLMLDYRETKDVLMWGMSDKYSWLQTWWPREDGLRKRPTLYDGDMRPKPMRDAVAQSFRRAPVRVPADQPN